MNLLLYLIGLSSALAALFCFSLGLVGTANNSFAVRRSLRALDLYGHAEEEREEVTPPFVDRVLKPLMEKLTSLGRRFSPVGYLDGLRQKLALAGSPKGLDVDRLLGFKGLCVVFGAIMALSLWLTGVSIIRLFFGVLLTIGSFFLPDLWLDNRIKKRQKAIRLALPDTLDLLTVSVEAGLGFDAALSKVVKNIKGPLAEEFLRFLQEVQLGTPRREAFKHLLKRTDVDDLNNFVLAMLQAEVFGISIGKVLRVQAQEMRIRRRQNAEETAMKVPVKIVFPLILCIFPALLIVIMGPAVIQIYEMLMGTI